MITLIAAAALAAQAPTAPANPPMMKMGEAAEHKGMDCCNDCCKDMAAKQGNGADGAAHPGHSGR